LGFEELRGGKNTHAHGYPQVKSVTDTGRVAKRVIDYPLIYGYGHGFDCNYTYGYPSPVINEVNY